MNADNKPLPIPNAVQRDANAIEILRVWIADGGQSVSLKPDAWDDPAAWGLMIADIARHVANAHAQKGKNKQDVLRKICTLFNKEMNNPTDEPRGELVD